jgi:hypothetical protein
MHERYHQEQKRLDKGDALLGETPATPAESTGNVNLHKDSTERVDVSELRSTHRKLRFRVPPEQVIVSEFATSSLAATTRQLNAVRYSLLVFMLIIIIIIQQEN